jgi:hypothetical protein
LNIPFLFFWTKIRRETVYSGAKDKDMFPESLSSGHLCNPDRQQLWIGLFRFTLFNSHKNRQSEQLSTGKERE